MCPVPVETLSSGCRDPLAAAAAAAAASFIVLPGDKGLVQQTSIYTIYTEAASLPSSLSLKAQTVQSSLHALTGFHNCG